MLLDSAFASMQKPGASRRIVAEMTLVKMCDESLNDSNTALLSRISRLEASLATANLAAPQPSARVPEESPESKPEKPSPETVKAKEPSVPAAPSPEMAEKSNKRVLKRLKAWPEILENIASRSGMLAGIIKTGKAYVEDTPSGEKFIVRLTDNGFTPMMMEKFKAKAEIRSAMCIVLRRDVTDEALLIEYCKPDSHAPDSAFEELVED